MAVNQLVVQVLNILQRDLEARNLGGTQTSETAQPQTTSAVNSPPAAATSMASSSGGGPTSSPLLFFVALGFGVVFTNLWIIVGVKYCFRYNARNRALRNGEDIDAVNLDNIPTRPHRRRKEKKLMTMDEVNDRFPLTKYKSWVASRAREGLPTTGGVTAPSSRAASLREVEGVIPSSPVDTKHSINHTRPSTAVSEVQPDATIKPANRKSMEATAGEQETAHASVEEQHNNLEQVRTTASTVDKHTTRASEADDEDDDDHIHTAVPPELLTNPGDSCAICIDTLEDDDDIRGLTCGHAFHAGCLDPWLTSRRACCPLCKADYYTPKPRPEGEAAEPERTGRSRRIRANAEAINAPPPPPSAWTGIRSHARLGPLGRFTGTPYTNNVQQERSRSARRAARRAQTVTNTQSANVPAVVPAENAQSPAVATPSRNWNPFSNLSMPAMRLPGRNRQPEEPPAPAAANATPAQLEAGVVR